VYENFEEGFLIMENKNLRVDVDYVIGRLEEIVNSVFLHTDAEEFLNELKENNKNHMQKNKNHNDAENNFYDVHDTMDINKLTKEILNAN